MKCALFAIVIHLGTVWGALAVDPARDVKMYHLSWQSWKSDSTAAIDGIVRDRAVIAQFCQEVNEAPVLSAPMYIALSAPDHWLIDDGAKLYVLSHPAFTKPLSIRFFTSRSFGKAGELKIGSRVKILRPVQRPNYGYVLSEAGWASFRAVRETTSPPATHPPYDP